MKKDHDAKRLLMGLDVIINVLKKSEIDEKKIELLDRASKIRLKLSKIILKVPQKPLVYASKHK